MSATLAIPSLSSKSRDSRMHLTSSLMASQNKPLPEPQALLHPVQKYGPPKVCPLQHRPIAPRLAAIEDYNCRQAELEYRDDIIGHIKSIEESTLADASMMDLQPELDWQMRPFLLDFLIDSHYSLRLQPQTLFLAINITDRYCSKRVVFKKHYQLVGCTALWIASKFEDKKSRVPTISELKTMCCAAYEEDMFVQMEGHILNTLDWNLGHPTIETFLGLVFGTDTRPLTQQISRYLCEITLFHRSFVGMSPSTIASSAYVLANHIVGNCPTLPPSLTQEQFQCASLLEQYMKNPSKGLASKYAGEVYCCASKVVEQFIIDKEREEQEQQEQQQLQLEAQREAQQQQQAHAQTNLDHPKGIPHDHIAMPPTPPPAFGAGRMFTPPSLSYSSSSSPSLFSTPGTAADTPVEGAFPFSSKQDIFIVPPAPSFKSRSDYMSPPCTPQGISMHITNKVNAITNVNVTTTTTSSNFNQNHHYHNHHGANQQHSVARQPHTQNTFVYSHSNMSAPTVYYSSM